MTSAQNWESIAANKRAALSDKIPSQYRIPEHILPPPSQLDVTAFPKESGWFTTEELEITESTATAILSNIASRAWTSEEVTRAFCKRSAAAHQLVGPASTTNTDLIDIYTDDDVARPTVSPRSSTMKLSPPQRPSTKASARPARLLGHYTDYPSHSRITST